MNQPSEVLSVYMVVWVAAFMVVLLAMLGAVLLGLGIARWMRGDRE